MGVGGGVGGCEGAAVSEGGAGRQKITPRGVFSAR